jgi:hypothetical protein
MASKPSLRAFDSESFDQDAFDVDFWNQTGSSTEVWTRVVPPGQNYVVVTPVKDTES